MKISKYNEKNYAYKFISKRSNKKYYEYKNEDRNGDTIDLYR